MYRGLGIHVLLHAVPPQTDGNVCTFSYPTFPYLIPWQCAHQRVEIWRIQPPTQVLFSTHLSATLIIF